MSNTAVGAVFKKIIDQVIETSRTDFEENGIDASVLASLQETWQQRLTSSHRASFPWDPQQPQQPAAEQPRQPPTASQQQANSKPAGPSPIVNNAASSSRSVQMGGMPIKQETNYETPGFLNLPQTAPYGSHPNAATHRAAQLMHASYGPQANQSISAMHAQQARQHMHIGGMQNAPNGQPYHNPQMPPIKTEARPPNSLGNAQTDGTGDDFADAWSSVAVGRQQVTNARIAANDGVIRQQVEAMNHSLEAGGLMIPLDERKTSRKGKARVADPSVASAAGPAEPPKGPARFDGNDDSPEEKPVDEEDAINSDLDDSDDELAEGIEDTVEGNVILCLFDKVQRVKNKWKTTLKDGVVTVDGKDYVFHKAQGEFEW